MAKATWNGQIIARSDDTVIIEGNHYFPAKAVDPHVLRPSTTQTTCPWKGQAHYYDNVVDGQVNPGAAWYYPEPKDAAKQIRGRVAFWRGVHVES